MDPLAVVFPDIEGYVDLKDNVRLHYELYKSNSSSNHPASSSNHPLLMLMGAFATKAHFKEMARHLADHSGCEVCIYDHRGVGRSSPPKLEAQTAASLAADALVVADTLWGPDTTIHVFGASMGGMIAQELALLLIPQHRLLSLSLSITCRGMKPLYGLLSPIFVPPVIKQFFELWYCDSRPNLVRRLMRLLLTRQLMDMVHPCGETYGQVYYKVWLERFDELWTFNNHTAGACHAHVVLHHYLTDTQLATIRDCGVPLLCQVSTQDNLIPAAMQFELADQLRARTITIPTGHLGLLPWRERYYNALLEQLAMGEAVKGVNRAERARRSSTGGGTNTNTSNNNNNNAPMVVAEPPTVTAAVPYGGGIMSALFTRPLLAALRHGGLTSSSNNTGSGSGRSSNNKQVLPSALGGTATSTVTSSSVPSSAAAAVAAHMSEPSKLTTEQAHDVTDMSVVLDDGGEQESSKEAAAAVDDAPVALADIIALASSASV